MKMFTKIMLVLLFSVFYANSTGQEPLLDQSQQDKNIPELTIKLVETHVSCNSACDGEIATLIFGIGPFTYMWSNGSENNSISNLCAGNYSVIVTNETGERAEASASIKEPALITAQVLITPQSLYIECNGAIEITNVKGGTPPYSFLWNTGFTNPEYLGICEGVHTVIISDKKKCSDELSIGLNSTKDCSDFLSNNGSFTTFCKPPIVQENNIESKVYPNPFSNQATLEFSIKNSGELKVLLYGFDGTLLKTLFNQEVRNDLTYRISLNSNELKTGLYYYRVVTDALTQSKSFIVVN